MLWFPCAAPVKGGVMVPLPGGAAHSAARARATLYREVPISLRSFSGIAAGAHQPHITGAALPNSSYSYGYKGGDVFAPSDHSDPGELPAVFSRLDESYGYTPSPDWMSDPPALKSTGTFFSKETSANPSCARHSVRVAELSLPFQIPPPHIAQNRRTKASSLIVLWLPSESRFLHVRAQSCWLAWGCSYGWVVSGG